jgi:hypothetical protein
MKTLDQLLDEQAQREKNRWRLFTAPPKRKRTRPASPEYHAEYRRKQWEKWRAMGIVKPRAA